MNMTKSTKIPVIDSFDNIYVSASEAAQILGIDVSNIIKVLKGKRNYAGGYSLRYYNPL